VDATTYLPIADWQTGSYGYYDVITWLRPTPALLAKLALPIPPGFTTCQHSQSAPPPTRPATSPPQTPAQRRGAC